MQVGCERDDGLLNIHDEDERCGVCAATVYGTVLSPHYGAVALWVGRPERRLMGFEVAWVDGLQTGDRS